MRGPVRDETQGYLLDAGEGNTLIRTASQWKNGAEWRSLRI
jgi:hypothetical protein